MCVTIENVACNICYVKALHISMCIYVYIYIYLYVDLYRYIYVCMGNTHTYMHTHLGSGMGLGTFRFPTQRAMLQEACRYAGVVGIAFGDAPGHAVLGD